MLNASRLAMLALIAPLTAAGAAACGQSAGSAIDGGADTEASLPQDATSGSEASLDAAPDVLDASLDAGTEASRDSAPADVIGTDAADANLDAPPTDSSESGDASDATSVVDADASVCAVSVGTGAEYVCAVRSDASLWCWGLNGYGQLGDGTTNDQSRPEHITGVPPMSAVATGIDSMCALAANGSVLCWGRNEFGEVGNGNTNEQHTPVVTIPSGVVSLGIGYTQHMCAIKSDGSLWCWGSDTSGESGGGRSTGMVLQPLQITGITGTPVVVAVGDIDTCVITNDTSLWCWGDNGYGQLGYATGSQPWSTTPQKVTAIGTGVVGVAVGFSQTCAVKNDGTLWCWGDNEWGQLGPEVDAGGTGTPTQVTDVGSNVAAVTACEHTCVRKTDGSVWCWGNNGEWQCGFSGASTPNATQVVGVSAATSVVSGVWNTCVLEGAGDILCWGTNGAGELGIGMYSTGTPTPTAPLLTCP